MILLYKKNKVNNEKTMNWIFPIGGRSKGKQKSNKILFYHDNSNKKILLAKKKKIRYNQNNKKCKRLHKIII